MTKSFYSGRVWETIVMTFVNESCFATVPSCTVSGFPSGIRRRDSLPSRRIDNFKNFSKFIGIINSYLNLKQGKND